MLPALALLLCCAGPALAQVVTAPEFLGSIAGPGAVVESPGVRFYRTDLGWTFAHRGTHNDADGAILIRFADHPWGPWSPPRVHLDPSDPAAAGDPYGPGGYIFNPACQDQPAARLLRPRMSRGRRRHRHGHPLRPERHRRLHPIGRGRRARLVLERVGVEPVSGGASADEREAGCRRHGGACGSGRKPPRLRWCAKAG